MRIFTVTRTRDYQMTIRSRFDVELDHHAFTVLKGVRVMIQPMEDRFLHPIVEERIRRNFLQQRIYP